MPTPHRLLASHCSLNSSQCNPLLGTEVRLKTVQKSSLGSLGALHVTHYAQRKWIMPPARQSCRNRALWKPAVTICHKAWCNSSVGCKIEKPSWGAVNHKQTCAHSCSCWDLMAEATPATAAPNARLSGSKRKKIPGSSNPNWDSYLHKVLQDNHPGVKITKEAMQVWAEALDAWLQQLA